MPWYVWSRERWSAGIASGAGLHFSASAKTPLLLFHELPGAGYWGSGFLVLLCGLAFVGRRQRAGRTLSFLALAIAVPVVSVFAADAVFDYFVAARQFMWLLPAVALLGMAGVERYSRVGIPLAILVGVFCLIASLRFFTAPREDWNMAATAISEHVKRGYCFIAAPPENARLYRFFVPELRPARCEGPRIVLAITPYTTNAQREATLAALAARGYVQESHSTVGGSRIELFRRKFDDP
ncbi:MAG: hypothetical protein M3Z09_06165 [Acidobacteriota bacterium]|nr:hypothetical protein [Acidobacteriota bacterium]